jgi:hypothetical protein
VNPNRRTAAVALIVFGVILVVFAIVYPYGDSANEETPDIQLPEEIAGQPVRAEAHGLQAIENITNLHGVEFELTGGAVGGYGTEGEITLWVSSSGTEAAATQLVIEMRNKIAQGDSPFEPVGEETIGGRKVYQLESFGQAHFYFQSGDLVIWLAADQTLADMSLAELLAFYP